jgi:hypothetical protein
MNAAGQGHGQTQSSRPREAPREPAKEVVIHDQKYVAVPNAV